MLLRYLAKQASDKNNFTINTITAANLTGTNSKDNIINSGARQTVSGGTGNDTIYGYASNVLYQYASGDGKDTITDYTAGQDKIKITSGAISSYSFSGDDVTFKIGSGSITVKDGNGKKITITDAQNKTTAQIYTNLASSADIFEDDNFISSSARIDDISEVTVDNFSVAEIKNFETFAQDNKFSANNFSEKPTGARK